MKAAIGDAKTCPHGHPINVGERIVGVPLGDVRRARASASCASRTRPRTSCTTSRTSGIEPGLEGTVTELRRRRGDRRLRRRAHVDADALRRGDGRGRGGPVAAAAHRAAGACSSSPRTATAAELRTWLGILVAGALLLGGCGGTVAPRVERVDPGRLEERDDPDQRSQQHRLPGGLRGPEGRRRAREHQRRACARRGGRHAGVDHRRGSANLEKAYGKAAAAAMPVATRLSPAHPRCASTTRPRAGRCARSGRCTRGHFYLVSFTASRSTWSRRLQALDGMLRSWRWQ